MNATLQSRSKSITDAIAQIETTGSLLDDYVVPTAGIKFINDPDMDHTGVKVFTPDFQTDRSFYSLHPNAIRQIGERFGVPAGFLATLVGGSEWQRELSVRFTYEPADTGVDYSDPEQFDIELIEPFCNMAAILDEYRLTADIIDDIKTEIRKQL